MSTEKSNQALKTILQQETALYIPHLCSLKQRLIAHCGHWEEWMIYRFIVWTRRAEFYQSRKGRISKACYLYCLRRANLLSEKLGFFIAPGVLGKSVKLYHKNVTINTKAIIGDGCIFHGNNCVGNNGSTNLCPKLGKNVELGFGAVVIGDVTLADAVKVGANAVVTKSCLIPGAVLIGVPATPLKRGGVECQSK